MRTMVRTVALAVSLFVSAVMNAQVTFKANAGVNVTKYDVAKKYGWGKSSAEVGFGLAGQAEYKFKNNLVLQSGLGFCTTNSTSNLLDANWNTRCKDVDVKLGHVIVPLNLGYKWKMSDSFSVTPSLGVYGSYNFSMGKCDMKYRDNITLDYLPAKWSPTKGFDYAFDVLGDDAKSIGTLQKMSKLSFGATVNVEFEYQKHYLFSVGYFESVTQEQKSNELRNKGVNISVGYAF